CDGPQSLCAARRALGGRMASARGLEEGRCGEGGGCKTSPAPGRARPGSYAGESASGRDTEGKNADRPSSPEHGPASDGTAGRENAGAGKGGSLGNRGRPRASPIFRPESPPEECDDSSQYRRR